eukprot:19332-Heterococcus_DN1.PRE.5
MDHSQTAQFTHLCVNTLLCVTSENALGVHVVCAQVVRLSTHTDQFHAHCDVRIVVERCFWCITSELAHGPKV